MIITVFRCMPHLAMQTDAFFLLQVLVEVTVWLWTQKGQRKPLICAISNDHLCQAEIVLVVLRSICEQIFHLFDISRWRKGGCSVFWVAHPLKKLHLCVNMVQLCTSFSKVMHFAFNLSSNENVCMQMDTKGALRVYSQGVQRNVSALITHLFWEWKERGRQKDQM